MGYGNNAGEVPQPVVYCWGTLSKMRSPDVGKVEKNERRTDDTIDAHDP
jgi:hypothetical protein